MAQLNNQYVSSSFQGLLKMTDSTQGLTNTLQTIQTGDGDNSPLQMSLTDVNISGSFFINNVPITNGTNGTSGTSGINGTDGSSGTSGASGSSGSTGSGGTSGTSGTDGTSGTSGLTDKTGLITTGSITDTQQITGSLILDNTIISGSLIGNTVNGGLIKIQSEANRSGSIQFNITGSNPISQSNVIFGGTAGPASVTQTGSVILSGSNNIILNGFRASTLTQGTYGYIGGNNNIVSTIPTIATGSLNITISNNQLNGLVTLDGALTSSFGSGSSVGNFNGNFILLQGTTLFRHKSGSFFAHNSNIGLGSFSSFATSSWLDDQFTTPQYIGNILQGTGTSVLNVSSSVLLTRNLINANSTTINNRFTNPTNYLTQGSGSLSITNNIIGGTSHTILSSGSNTSNRNIVNNLVVGSSHLLNQISSGSNSTILSNTSVLGASLIVSGSNSSTTGGGSVIVGRYNATGSLQESSQDTVFVVGTGTSDGSRRNALRIDSNNNSNFTGSVNISGSLNVTNKINDLKIWTGSANVNSIGIGNNTLQFQSSSSNLGNVAIGNGALSTNVTGAAIVAIGGDALRNSVAGFNLAIGSSALQANTTGRYNIAIGQSSYQANTIGEKNTAIGWNSGVNNLTGSTNTIIGAQALSNNVNGSGNVAIGHYAGYYSTGSNGFYIGNDDYGGLNTEQEKSMMYGEFNNTTNNQSLRINAKTNITNNLVVTGSIDITGTYYVNGVAVGGDRNGLITTGSFGGAQSITGSLNVGATTISTPASGLNILSGSIDLNDNGQSRINNAQTGRNVMYVDNDYSNFFFGNVPKAVNNRFSGDTNNFVLSPTYSDFQTGSRNLIFAVGNTFFNSGSNNIFIGDGQPFGNSVDDSLYIGINGSSVIQKGNGQPIQLGHNTQITGSLNVSNGSTITGSLSVSNGITLTGNQFKITDQPITFSSSYAIGTANDVAINYTQGVGLGIRNGNIQIGREAGQNFLNTPDTAGNFLFGQYGGQSFESGSGNVFLHTGGSSFISGSNNVLVGRNYATITGGTSNVILGGYDAPETNISEYMSLGNSVNSFITKRTSQPIRMSESLTITGSLIVSGSGTGGKATFTNNVAVSGSLTVRNTRLSNGLQISNFTNDISAADPYIQVNSLDGLNEYKLQVTNSGSYLSGSYSQDGSLNMTGSLVVSGDVRFASGSNKTMGTVVLDGANPGVATVSNSLVTTSSLIFLTKQTNTHSGNGTVSVTSKGTGTFSITSNHNGDTDTVAYQIINPA